MKRYALTLLAALLSGCASTGGMLENRIVCTPSGDTPFIVSMWGFFGIATKVSEKDATAVCRKG